MTDQERIEMHRQAREAAAEYSYGDSSSNPGRILEVRKASNAVYHQITQEAAI